MVRQRRRDRRLPAPGEPAQLVTEGDAPDDEGPSRPDRERGRQPAHGDGSDDRDPGARGSAGATHGLTDYCREANLGVSVGHELTEPVRAAIPHIPEDAWVAALDQDGSARKNGEVAEITDSVDLSSWPQGARLIVRRERPHPGAQLSFTDHDGYRFQAILTDQDERDIAVLECRHRQHAHVEDRIRDDKDTGPAKFPFKELALNEVWLEIVMLAHDLIGWTQALLLSGELAKAEPKRLRYRLLHVAARLAFSGRRAKRRLQHDWP